MKINTIYNRERPPALDFSKTKSRTKQQFASEANINNIMSKYIKTGVLPSGDRQPSYGDFSDGVEYKSIIIRIQEAKEQFASLPSETRALFGNDPSRVLDFIANPENREDAIKLGLVQAQPSADEPVLEDVKPAPVVTPTDPEIKPEEA